MLHRLPELADVARFSVAARSLLARLDSDEPGASSVMAPFDLAGDNPFTADAVLPVIGRDRSATSTV